MNILELIYYISSIISSIFVVFGVFVALKQIKKMKDSNEIQKQSVVADHKRRKSQSTIEFYDKINQETNKIINFIYKKREDGVLNKDDFIDKFNDEEREKIKRYLVLMERFSVGINTNVYDIEVFYRIAGFLTINIHEKLREYIKFSRTEGPPNPNRYGDFEQMVNSLNSIATRGNTPNDNAVIGAIFGPK